MIAAASLALRKAVLASLTADAPLAARLGGPRIFDEAPRAANPPYVGFGDIRSRDWSTSTDAGAEHTLTIEIWSQHHGAQEPLEIAAFVAAALSAAPPAPVGHRLISILPQSVETRREDAGRFIRARQIFRAITEKI